MGILGLLQYLKNCQKERRLGHYHGKTAAVDTYAWLHKIIKGPSGKQLILGGPNRYRYVNDCLRRIAKIQNQGVKVIMVFDGGPLPCKREEEQSRKKRRDEQFAKGKQLLDSGDEAGYKKLVDSIDISPDIANRLIIELKKKGIDYIVAPYQADAQLAYLSRKGIVDVIITEDSDLMAFGAKKMLYKLDFTTMVGWELDLDEVKDSSNFAFFTHCMFLTTCILSGCDYLTQINKIGLKTAQKYIGRVNTFRGFLGELGSKASDVPANYDYNFMKAFLTFRFQRVFCPRQRKCVELNDIDELGKSMEQIRAEEDMDRPWSEQVINLEVLQFVTDNNLDFQFLGEKYDDEKMCAIADGDIHPVTFAQFDEHFAQRLTYVFPAGDIKRTNSILTGARKAHSVKYPGKNQFNQQQNGMNKFLQQGQKKQQKFNIDSFEYRSLISGQRVEIQCRQNRQKSAPEIRPIRGLMLRQSEQESDNESSVVQQEISDAEKEMSISSRIPLETRSVNVRPVLVKSCKDSLEHIAEQLFGQIFSQEYLRSPFSF